ncbi:MAG: flagellar basal body protein FliL [Treponema sp.]|nr:flagellar basal body protein FliL [Treponema sp.]
MSDSDDLDMEGGESPEAGSSFKKKSRLVSILPTILKFTAIGIAAVIFIVTVSVITVNVTRTEGRAQGAPDPMSPFIGTQPILQWFTGIGTINTQTRDLVPHTVSVVMQLGFDQGDQAASSELFGRQHELRDFTRRYFASLFAEDLRPENEARLRREIMDILNTRYLSNARVRMITFERLDVMPVF